MQPFQKSRFVYFHISLYGFHIQTLRSPFWKIDTQLGHERFAELQSLYCRKAISIQQKFDSIIVISKFMAVALTEQEIDQLHLRIIFTLVIEVCTIRVKRPDFA